MLGWEGGVQRERTWRGRARGTAGLVHSWIGLDRLGLRGRFGGRRTVEGGFAGLVWSAGDEGGREVVVCCGVVCCAWVCGVLGWGRGEGTRVGEGYRALAGRERRLRQPCGVLEHRREGRNRRHGVSLSLRREIGLTRRPPLRFPIAGGGVDSRQRRPEWRIALRTLVPPKGRVAVAVRERKYLGSPPLAKPLRSSARLLLLSRRRR